MEEYAKIAIKFIEYAEKLGFLDRLIAFFSKPCTCLLLGASGAGKTSFMKSISVG